MVALRVLLVESLGLGYGIQNNQSNPAADALGYPDKQKRPFIVR